MEVYTIKDLSFTYPKSDTNTLDNINLSVPSGEFICLCGKSGCGKTTLLRLMKPVLAPFGEQTGEIYFNLKNINELEASEQASKIGFVMQDIESQLVTDKVWHELAFGLESLGIATSEIRSRVSEMAEFFGIGDWFYKSVSELSGGQKQLLNLASVMVMQPDILILDEPVSQLDPIAASEFIGTVAKINRELGTTVIISEHRLEEIFSVADRVIVIDNGKITADAAPADVGHILYEINSDMVSALPTPTRVFNAVYAGKIAPITVRDGRKWLSGTVGQKIVCDEKTPSVTKSDESIRLKDVWFRYERNTPDIIKGLSLSVNKGEFHAIIGGNGTGKSTALSLICGVNKPYGGKVITAGGVVMLPQNPQIVFVKKTVREDLEDMQADSGRLTDMIKLCELENLLDRHPYDLSGGETQRAALAKVLLKKPDILLLDEPTKGLDAAFKSKLAELIKKLANGGITVVMVSHDIEFCAEHADMCSMFFDGAVTSTQTPQKMFGTNSFYTTAASRMSRGIIENAVVAKDIINILR